APRWESAAPARSAAPTGTRSPAPRHARQSTPPADLPTSRADPPIGSTPSPASGPLASGIRIAFVYRIKTLTDFSQTCEFPSLPSRSALGTRIAEARPVPFIERAGEDTNGRQHQAGKEQEGRLHHHREARSQEVDLDEDRHRLGEPGSIVERLPRRAAAQ